MTDQHTPLPRRVTAWCGAATLALALTACGDSDTAAEPAPTTPLATEAAGARDATATGTDLTADNALAAIAQAESAGGVVHDLERSDDDSGWELEVVLDGTHRDVTVSPDGATVLQEDERGDVDADDQAELDSADVTITEAIETAVDDRGESLEEASLDEVSLEEEDGTLVWVVELRSGAGDDGPEVLVDASGGTVVGTDG